MATRFVAPCSRISRHKAATRSWTTSIPRLPLSASVTADRQFIQQASQLTSVGLGPENDKLNTEIAWAAFPGTLNLNFADSWFNGNASENFTSLGLLTLGGFANPFTFIDHFEGYVDGPDGRIWGFDKRVMGTQSKVVGNQPGKYTAYVFADDFAGHQSSQSISFKITDDDTVGPRFLHQYMVGFDPQGETIVLVDSQERDFYWVVEDQESGLSSVQATLGTHVESGTFDSVVSGEQFRNQGIISTRGLPFGNYTLTVTAVDADNDYSGDGATSQLKQTIRFTDDDTRGPTIQLTGPSGTADDEDDLVFGWNISDPSGLHSYSVVVTDGQGDQLNAANPPSSGSFDFNAYPPGRYTITVTATDDDYDRGRSSDRQSSSESRTVVISDSDRAAPVIRFTDGSGRALLGTGHEQSHGVSNAIVWDVLDQSGVHPVEARLYRDEILVRTFQGPAQQVELLDSDGLGMFRLELTATELDDNQWDGDQQSTTASATLTITNDPPTVFAGGPYVVTEGQPLIVAAVGSDPDPGDTEQLVFSWDLDGDGDYNDAVGANPTIPWSILAAAGIADDGTYSILARAADLFGETATSSATVTVFNAPPQVESISADPFIDENTTITATGRYSDPSPLDTHQVVVFWGDGTSSTAVVNQDERTFTATHHYADDRPSNTEFDDYVLRVEVIDDEGAVNPQRSRTLTVETNSTGGIELPSFPLSLPSGVSGLLQSATVLVDPQSSVLDTTSGQSFNHEHYYEYPAAGPFDLAGTWTSTVSAAGSHTHTLDIPSQTKTFTASDWSLLLDESILYDDAEHRCGRPCRVCRSTRRVRTRSPA